MDNPPPLPAVKLAVPRHLQDYNGYCGPACAMMVLSAEAGASVPAQQAIFREIRDHAKQANDRRPVKSPAESLLALLAKHGPDRWKKVFDPTPDTVAGLLIRSVESLQRPCLMLVSKGMHWVVAFGRTRRADGSVAGVLLRDPAWAGMPAFYGLSVFPEKSTFTHTGTPCVCLQSDNPPGSVHERYMAMGELVSPRGLQGSPDWEGKGALALVPAELDAAAAPLPPASPPPAPAPGLTSQAAAMIEARDHGLVGRPDSPPDWQQTLDGGQPGSPILVKDPDDSRDDFLLVPVHPKDATSRRTAWVMLDPVTLRLREASLLDNWMVPGFPTEADADKISSQHLTLADGTHARFKKTELRPNQHNLVWQASAATILPYWPLREFIAPHPVTGEPTPIYVTQHGKIYTSLAPDEPPSSQPPAQPEQPETKPGQPSDPSPKGNPWLGIAAIAGAAVAVCTWLLAPKPGLSPDATGGGTGGGGESSVLPNPDLPVLQASVKNLANRLPDLKSAQTMRVETGRKLEQELARLWTEVPKLRERRPWGTPPPPDIEKAWEQSQAGRVPPESLMAKVAAFRSSLAAHRKVQLGIQESLNSAVGELAALTSRYAHIKAERPLPKSWHPQDLEIITDLDAEIPLATTTVTQMRAVENGIQKAGESMQEGSDKLKAKLEAIMNAPPPQSPPPPRPAPPVSAPEPQPLKPTPQPAGAAAPAPRAVQEKASPKPAPVPATAQDAPRR